MPQSKALTSGALTFFSAFTTFSCLSLQNRLAVRIHKAHNFHAVTVFLNMTSTRLPALLAGEAVGEKGKLGSGGTKSFESGG